MMNWDGKDTEGNICDLR